MPSGTLMSLQGAVAVGEAGLPQALNVAPSELRTLVT
jgi:hypothetical protein